MMLLSKAFKNLDETGFKMIAGVLSKLIFGFTSIVIFYISISGINNGMPLVPVAGLIIFGVLFFALAFSSKEVLDRVFENS